MLFRSKYLSGDIFPVGKETEAKQFFTGSRGNFQVVGLKPGRYQLKFYQIGYKPVIIEIPDDADSFFDRGDIFVHNE